MPIGLFDTVATAVDAMSFMVLTGWTNDRQVKARISQLPEGLWVCGRADNHFSDDA